MPITQEQTAASIWFAAAKCQSFCHRWVAIMAARLVRWEMYSENQYHLDGNESGMLQRMPLNDQDATKKYTKWLTRKNRVSNSYWNKDITTLLAGLLGVMGDLNPSTTNMFMGYWLSLFVWDIIHPSNTGPTCLMDFRRHSLYQDNARAVFILVQATKWIRNFLWPYIRPVHNSGRYYISVTSRFFPVRDIVIWLCDYIMDPIIKKNILVAITWFCSAHNA